MGETQASMGRRILQGALRAVKGLLRILGVLLLTVVVSIVTFLVFFIATPDISLDSGQVRWIAERVLPSSVLLTFRNAQVRVLRPEGMWLAKHLVIKTEGLCARYEMEAVRTCFDDIDIGATAGWGGKPLAGESDSMPRLISIDPIRMLGGQVQIDADAFPKSEEKEDQGGISVVDLLRKQILPKWKIEGSRIELKDFVFQSGGERYQAAFDLTTQQNGETLRAALHHLVSSSGDLKASGLIRVTRPGDWLETEKAAKNEKSHWKVWADADVDLAGPARVQAKADANIYDWQTLDFRLGSHWKGVPAVREARLEGALHKDAFDGRTSVKFGNLGSEVRMLDFVNCAVDANLATKVGGLECGPETVRLKVRERSLIQRRGLYTFAPQFNFRITRLAFGDQKEAEFTLDLGLSHLGFLGLRTQLAGTVWQSAEQGLRYNVNGTSDLVANQFQGVVNLLRKTPYAIPAPLNVLNGLISLHVGLELNEKNGSVSYSLVPELDSKFQSVHMDVSGTTRLSMEGKGLSTSTEAAIQISKLHFSAPRIDLRIPPQILPDSRFGPIRIKGGDFVKPKKEQAGPPMDFKLRIVTTRPNAIQVATNLTKSPIPVSLDLIYEERAPKRLPEQKPPSRAPASILDKPIRTVAENKKPEPGTPPPAIRGVVQIGETPIDLFRRNAVLERLKVELLPDGRQKIDGVAKVHYLEYDINVLLQGLVSDPQVKFSSSPPLEDDQILSVLLFGRPFNELDEDQKTSISSVNSAFADAALGLSSLYLFATTPIESIGYDPEKQAVTARLGLGGGTTLQVESGGDSLSAVGFRKKLSRDIFLRSDVETIANTGKRTVSAFVEWVKRF